VTGESTDIIDDIIHAEIDYPRTYTNTAERAYGLLFHNGEVPDSHMSNHARVFRAEDDTMAAAVADLTAFYRDRGLRPCVFSVSRPCGAGTLRNALASAGFTFRNDTDRFFIHRETCRPKHVPDVQVGRASNVSAGLAEMMLRSDRQWMPKVLERQLRLPSFHLLEVFASGRPVCMGTLQELGKCSYVDHVLTDKEHRGKGYACSLLDYLLDYHAAEIGNTLYLRAENPTAIRIYQEAGFVELEGQLESWSAWLE